MNLVFVFAASSVFRHLEGVLMRLAEQGHNVTIVTTLDDGSAHPNVDGQALLGAVERQPRLTLANWRMRAGHSRRWVRLSRELRNYATFYRRGHPSRDLRNRWQKYLSPRIWRVVGHPAVGAALASPPARAALQLVEKAVAPVPSIGEWLRAGRFDAAVACPYILPDSLEVEYVKAAKALGLPTMVAVQSWDNLTTKGTFAVMPDRVFVWNAALRDEAIALHDVPADSICVTGAPTFDYWFEARPAVSREEFLRNAGLDPARPYVVYLCSSRGMIEEERAYVADLAAKMQANPATRDVSLLVRPHPLNMVDWSRIVSERVAVWPPRGAFTDNPVARQDFFHTLYFCAATVGVNTSAMLEAAVADRPCITVIDNRYRSAQGGMGHFRHLLDGGGGGGFLFVANSYEEASKKIGEILAGHDSLRDNRRAFVARFIRPRGMDVPASTIMAREIISFVEAFVPAKN